MRVLFLLLCTLEARLSQTPPQLCVPPVVQPGKPLGKPFDAIRHAGRVIAGTLGLSELRSLFTYLKSYRAGSAYAGMQFARSTLILQ